MTLRQWLLTRLDGRRRIDLLHGLLCSTITVLPSGNSPLDVVRGRTAYPNGPGDPYYAGLDELVQHLDNTYPGFWSGFGTVKPAPRWLHLNADLGPARTQFMNVFIVTLYDARWLESDNASLHEICRFIS